MATMVCSTSLFGVLMLGVFVPAYLTAQTLQAQITGVVSDASGAVAPKIP